MVDEAIEHTPTTIDCYMLKARIYKVLAQRTRSPRPCPERRFPPQHAGDLSMAFAWMDKARRLDLADRYLNTKSPAPSDR